MLSMIRQRGNSRVDIVRTMSGKKDLSKSLGTSNVAQSMYRPCPSESSAFSAQFAKTDKISDPTSSFA
jgi:hypothetical protein